MILPFNLKMIITNTQYMYYHLLFTLFCPFYLDDEMLIIGSMVLLADLNVVSKAGAAGCYVVGSIMSL